MKKMVRDTIHAGLYGPISNPNLCKGLARPQQKLKERHVDIIDDPLL
jgi:hypothetical protein